MASPGAVSGNENLLHLSQDDSTKKFEAEMQAMQLAASSLVPELRIIEQTSVTHEHYQKNAIQKMVHVVVKNLMFSIEVTTNTGIDLNRCNLEAKLLYDFDKDDESRVEVSYVKNEPLDYKVNVSENGTKATVELKIKVLTSQHEDMLFRVRLSATDPSTGAIFEALSQPIKVISKLTQKPQASPSQKKRTTNDMLQTTLSKIEEAQLELRIHQQELINSHNELNKKLEFIMNKLFVDPSLLTNASSLHANTENLHTLSNLITQQVLSSEDHNNAKGSYQQKQKEFDYAASRFLGTLNELSPDDKRAKIEAFIENASGQSADKLVEFFDMIDSSPAKKRLRTNSHGDLL